MFKHFRAVAALTAASLALLVQSPASAMAPVHDHIVSDNPVNYTPNVEDGQVDALLQVGTTMIAVGRFSTVTPAGSSTSVTRNNIFAFDATTGMISDTFAPNIGAEVFEVVDAGDGTVYVGGKFSSVNGAPKTARVARINVSDGQVVSTFQAPGFNGNIRDMQLINGKLYVGGTFTTVGGQPRTLLAALNPLTGADTGTVNLTFTDTWNGGVLRVEQFDISDDGSTLVAIGNFRNVNGQSRPQVAMINTSGAQATLSGWATNRFTTQCAGKFDTYMYDVDIAPSGSYFAIIATGAYSGGVSSGTLCDTTSRWEIGPTTAGQNPTWIDYSGGDTGTQVQITGPVIYIGGHHRWMNNPFAADAAGAGAVPRPGLAALDPRNGLPFSWNPGRARGWGVRDFLPTADGLWIGHDTNMLGGEIRKRIAFMPLLGGATIPADNTGTLPGDVYSLGGQATSAASGHWISRVNAGGPMVLANDNGPDWSANTGGEPANTKNSSSPDLTFGRTANVPGTTPQAIFSTERWSSNDSPPMQWNFPAPLGDQLTVRLYFANSYRGTGNPGQRVFDVNIDGGAPELTNYDIAADVGNQTGTMKDFNIVSDGNVDIDFSHVVENPLVNGIEIIDNSVPAPGAVGNDTVVRRTFTGSSAGSPQTLSSSVGWSSDRGAVMIDNKLFTGWSDGTFKVRTFDGTTFGDASDVNLYGLTAFSNEASNMTGMFFDKATGRLYFTQAGQSELYYRYFTPESQIVGALRFKVAGNTAGINWQDTSGMFLAGGNLYIGSSSDGNLRRVGWSNGSTTGSLSAPISGPATGDGNDYRARGMFLYAG